MLWTKHTSNIRSTAFRWLCFIRRNLKHSTRDVKLAAYKAYIRPLLEYGIMVWTPFTKTGADQCQKLKKEKEVLCLNYRQTVSVRRLNWCTLEPLTVRRMVHIIEERKHCSLNGWNLLYHKQKVLRSGLSTMSQIVQITHNITSAPTNKVRIMCMYFLYIFGNVPRTKPVEKKRAICLILNILT